jgi:hypothetical protein
VGGCFFWCEVLGEFFDKYNFGVFRPRRAENFQKRIKNDLWRKKTKWNFSHFFVKR